MRQLVRTFVQANINLSSATDKLIRCPPKGSGALGRFEPGNLFASGKSIADVGGGKKPFAHKRGLEVGARSYVGLDIDPGELAQAPPGSYTEICVVNIEAPSAELANKFDLIICRSTLEHVENAERALAGLFFMLSPGGLCFLRLPCRHALFARLNLLLPNTLKRRMLHSVFPHKSGDGFPAFYDKASPGEYHLMVEKLGGCVVAEERSFKSSYFSFFFPLFVLWRIFTAVQYFTNRNYCEAFSMVVKKPANGL